MHGWCTTPPARDAGREVDPPQPDKGPGEGGTMFVRLAILALAGWALMGGKL